MAGAFALTQTQPNVWLWPSEVTLTLFTPALCYSAPDWLLVRVWPLSKWLSLLWLRLLIWWAALQLPGTPSNPTSLKCPILAAQLSQWGVKGEAFTHWSSSRPGWSFLSRRSSRTLNSNKHQIDSIGLQCAVCYESTCSDNMWVLKAGRYTIQIAAFVPQV